jgi:hypothetical protein
MTKAIDSRLPSCASRRRPPAPRRASTPASSRSSASTSTSSTRTKTRSTCLEGRQRRGARQQIAKAEQAARRARRARCRPRSRRSPRPRPAGDGNLLALAIDAAAPRATVGEISDALEKVFGRHRRDPNDLRRVRAAARTPTPRLGQAPAARRRLRRAEGRRPRILVAKMGQDGHDRGAEGHRHRVRRPRLRRRHRPAVPDPEEVARQAVENDVHVVGVSSLAAGHLTLVPGQPAGRAGQPGRGRRRRPVVAPHRRVDPRRPHPDGRSLTASGRVRPAQPERPAPRRCGAGDARVDARPRGGRLRRHHRRDGRGGAERDRRLRDGRHLPAADPGAGRATSCRASSAASSSSPTSSPSTRPTATARGRRGSPRASSPARCG